MARRPPQLGEIWWANNTDLGIKKNPSQSHPILVVRGLHLADAPVVIAPGSSHRDAGDLDLVVDPEDCLPVSSLERRTRFDLNRHQRLPQARLGRRMGMLSPEKIEELKGLRERIF